MEEFLNELLTFIDKKTDWKVNNNTTNSQVINEFLYRNKELTAQFIASVGKSDSDTGGGLHLAVVMPVCPQCGSNHVVTWVYEDKAFCVDCEHQWAN